MKNAMINKTHIEGVLYQHDLELKVTGDTSKNPGTEYITGTVEIATDDAGVNIVLEFPFILSMQSSDYFAANAVKILSDIGVTDIICGCEDAFLGTVG